jgi:alpha-glucoside transport system ATP-binding protein
VATQGDQQRIYRGKVNITEALGEVTLLYFEPQGENDPVIGKLSGIHKGLRGNEVELTADPAKVHVFMNTQSLLYRDQEIKNIATRGH